MLNQYDYPEKMSKKNLELDKKIVMDWKAKSKILATEIDVNDDLFE